MSVEALTSAFYNHSLNIFFFVILIYYFLPKSMNHLLVSLEEKESQSTSSIPPSRLIQKEGVKDE